MIVRHASQGVHKSVLLRRLIDAHLVRSASVSVDDIPDFHLANDDLYLGEHPEKKGNLTLLPPCLVFPIEIDQIMSEQCIDVQATWRPARKFRSYYLYGVALSDQPSTSHARDTFLPTHLTFGEAACIAAQFPLLERCRVLQAGPCRLQAYFHSSLNRMVLDNQPHGGNQYHHTARLLWIGGRTYHGDHAELSYDRKSPVANPA